MIANKSNKAIVLIATIATLAVISVILMFFAQSSIFERQLTSNNNLERQAKLVATASIEWAASYIPKLAMGADDGDLSVSNKAYSSVADFYQFKVINNNESGKYDPHCPVEEHYLIGGKGIYKGIPSFYYNNKEEKNLPYEYSYRQDFDANMIGLPTVHNKNFKVINNAPETEEIKKKRRWTAHSTLKCVDANAFWNINSPIKTKEYDTNADYKNMVTTLVSVVLGKNEAIIDKWSKEREKGEFADLGDFCERMSSLKGMKQEDLQKYLDKICRYITVDSWGNEKSFKYGADYTNYDQELPAIFEKRYPININVASWEILTVIFANIQANHDHNHTKSISKITPNEAQKLAKDIVKDRTNHNNGAPFKTWNEVEDYLYKYFGDSKKDQAEAIFAVIYPGMLPHKKSPNKAQYRKFDKSDIEVGTTECCLFSPGVFYCEAIGRVIEYRKEESDAPYNILSHSKVSVNMKLWEPYIVNSQSDFEWQRHKDKPKLATWSGLEGGYYPEEYPARKNETESKSEGKNEVSAGFLQERGYWNSEDSKGKTYPDACRFWPWFDKAEQSGKNNNPFEKRPDGIYMKPSTLTNDQVVRGILEKVDEKWKDDSEWEANKWKDDGFDLWIKPSYDDNDNVDAPVTKPILIAVKKEKAETIGPKCYILTRCSYDIDNSLNDEEKKYLTISRTLVTDDTIYGLEERKPSNGRDFRIFYNSTIIERDKEYSTIRKNLYLAGSKIFSLLLAYIQSSILVGTSARVSFTTSKRVSLAKFSEDFSNQVYCALMQEDESVLIKDFKIYTKDHGTETEYTGDLEIYLPFYDPNITQDKERWCHSRINKCEGLFKNDSDRDFVFKGTEGAVFILEYLFQKKNALPTSKDVEKIPFNTLPTDSLFYYGYVTRKSQQKEATELDWFPGKNFTYPDVPIQTKYKYSRTESRIPITLHKGCWYHIHARWEDNKILLTDFKVHYKDGDKIKEDPGQLYKNLFGSPGRVWTTSDNYNKEERMLYPPDPHKEGNKTYFYCPNCVISFSHYRTQNKAWRYWSDKNTSSVYTGNFNEGNSDTGDQPEDDKFNLPKMYKSQKHPKYFYYGTVAWTQFYPKDKNNNTIKEAIFFINKDKDTGQYSQFYSWGEDNNPPENKINSIFMQQYNNKGNDPKASFRFELHDEGGDASASHLETTIVDRVVLYMIVQPQPIHWSYNTYKDKNLYH